MEVLNREPKRVCEYCKIKNKSSQSSSKPDKVGNQQCADEDHFTNVRVAPLHHVPGQILGTYSPQDLKKDAFSSRYRTASQHQIFNSSIPLQYEIDDLQQNGVQYQTLLWDEPKYKNLRLKQLEGIKIKKGTRKKKNRSYHSTIKINNPIFL